jgi:hypothetical protein
MTTSLVHPIEQGFFLTTPELGPYISLLDFPIVIKIIVNKL